MNSVLEWLGIKEEITDEILKKIQSAVENTQIHLNRIDTQIIELESSQSLEEDKDPRKTKDLSKLQNERRRVFVTLKNEINSILK